MRINHNIAALNTYRQLSSNTSSTSKSLEKLSSGLRINRAGDDAAGLAISEKMRGQIRGLDQATRNSQDGISLIQTAEGALSETHSILQRMKELATQASNGTNTDADRAEIQKEVNQLSSEINRIGNTTEFNTQSLLKGDGKVNLGKTNVAAEDTTAGKTTNTNASQTVSTADIAAGDANNGSFKVILNGQELNITLTSNEAGGAGNPAIDTTQLKADSVTSNSATIEYNAATGGSGITDDDMATALKGALEKIIEKNDTLKGNYKVEVSGASITMTAQNDFAGGKGHMGVFTGSGDGLTTTTLAASTGKTVYADETKTLDYSTIDTKAKAQELVGKGFSINGTQYEFYDADAGSYTGSANGINISEALNALDGANDEAIANAVAGQLKADDSFSAAVASGNTVTLTATAKGDAGVGTIKVEDGGIQKNYKTTFQVGANQGQSFAIEFSDMRSDALGITGKEAGGAASNGAVYTKVLDVTNGTDDVNVEYALDVSTTKNASNAIKVLDEAITTVSAERSKMGAYQNRLEHTINNLGTTAENLTAAESRIRDVDMAKEMMEFTKNNILSQAAQAMLAQANQQPQSVLQLLQ